MGECVNLQNLHSSDNKYVKQDLKSIRHLRRIYSYNDEYEIDKNCFLEDLF